MPIACKAFSVFVAVFDSNKKPILTELVPFTFLGVWGGLPKTKEERFRKLGDHYFVISEGFDAEFATKNAHAHLLKWEG